MNSLGHFCLALCSFGPPSYALSGGFNMERGGMPLHGVVGTNCKIGATTENQSLALKYMV